MTVILIFVEIATVIAIGISGAKILSRLGYSRLLMFLAYIPVGNAIALWKLTNAELPWLAGQGER